MPYIQSQPVFDVCIVGSGAGGGMAAKMLTEAGANVVMLEAGGDWDASRDGDMLTWNYESARRGRGTKDRPFGEFDGCIGGWEIDGEPYTRAEGTEWDWFRARMLGGRTHHWGRISLRFGPDDFKRGSIDGKSDDWPISYDDLKPYYDRVDRMIGIFGNADGQYNEPDGIYMEPPKPRCYELMVKESAEKLGIPVLASRLSILTQRLGDRPACHYCGQCNRGCMTGSNFSSQSVLLPPALATGRLQIITRAMAREVLTDREGQAAGVSYVDTPSRQEYQVRAKIVVLAASACESARLLLNSKSVRHPNGLGNSSDVVGRYLMDSTGSDVMGYFPQLVDMPVHNEDGVGGMHIYIPWWREKDRSLPFSRGYHIEVWGGRGMPGYGFGGGIHRVNGKLNGGDRSRGGGGYGVQLKDDYRRLWGSFVGMSGRGEMIGRRENHCEIDPGVVDTYGIPVLRFNVSWSDEEILQIKHFQETGHELIRTMGGQPMWDIPSAEDGYGILAPGRIIHEVGTTRMGNDSNTSVLNSNCQSHEVNNLFVVDAGPFVSQPHKNPTWTILAMSMRTSEAIAAEVSKRNLGTA
ncbi:MAG: GMC family oxidoreductase [Bacteroidetes bacterium]|nr:GMC family oxidoreductase [Bacteroidota bacterium]